MLQEIFLQTFNLFNTDFIFVLQRSQIRRVLKKKKKKIQKELCIHKDLIMATFPCKSNNRRKNNMLQKVYTNFQRGINLKIFGAL